MQIQKSNKQKKIIISRLKLMYVAHLFNRFEGSYENYFCNSYIEDYERNVNDILNNKVGLFVSNYSEFIYYEEGLSDNSH